jgi:hypothetical protein
MLVIERDNALAEIDYLKRIANVARNCSDVREG